jgi:predicted enzyme related to lactoylglutathione lyase
MPERAFFKSVFPMPGSDPKNLPVRDLESSIAFYQESMGFKVESRKEAPHKSARLRRDQVEIGLAENGGAPEQASCYLFATDVELAYQEFEEKGCNMTTIKSSSHDGRFYRVFFLRAPDGLCYCIGQPDAAEVITDGR